jgi:hypothetical protein
VNGEKEVGSMQQKDSNSTAWALTLLLAMFLQVAFVFVDAAETPARAAVDFSKAYFRLDPAMAERICEERLTVDDVYVVDQHLYRMRQQAEARGFDLPMLKKGLYHVETQVVAQSEEEAQVRISAVTRTRVNPVYVWVASIFHLGDTEQIEETLFLVKEDGKWKACGENIFALPGE